MATIEKLLIHFNKNEDFIEENNAENILDTSIVFIKDSDKIHTHKEDYQFIEWSVLEKQKQIIVFKIIWTQYEAEENMTFEEWVNSEYNNKFHISGDKICDITGAWIYDRETKAAIKKSDTIIPNFAYGLYGNTGGGRD